MDILHLLIISDETLGQVISVNFGYRSFFDQPFWRADHRSVIIVNCHVWRLVSGFLSRTHELGIEKRSIRFEFDDI